MAWASTSPLASSTLVSRSTTGWPGAGPCRPTPPAAAPRRPPGRRRPGRRWAARPSPRAGTEPGGGDAHGGQRPPRHDRGGQQRRTGRRGELDGDVDSVGGCAPQQGDHRWRGVGEEPVGGTDHPGARRHRAGMDGVDPQDLERSGGAHHVDDGVEPPDLVEVDLFGRPPVQLPLDVGQRPERTQCPAGDPLGSRASSTIPVMCAAVRTTADSTTWTCALVAAMPPRSTGSASSRQPSDRQPPQQLAYLVEVGPRRSATPVPCRPRSREAVEPRDGGRAVSDTGPKAEAARRSSQEEETRRRGRRRQGGRGRAYPGYLNIAEDGARGAEAVVDADDGEPGGAGGEHGQQRGDPAEARAIRRWWARPPSAPG